MYSHDIVLEEMMDIVNVQESKSRINYKGYLMEAANGKNPEAQAKMVNALYTEVMTKKDMYDTGNIDKSAGNILKLDHYDTTSNAIDQINALLENYKIQSVTCMNSLQDMMISCRSDFEYGYRFNVPIIRMIYENLVLCLYELIDISIVTYTDMMKDPNHSIPKNVKSNQFHDFTIIKASKGFIDMYKNGDWAKFMKQMKDPKVAAAGESAIMVQIKANGDPDMRSIVDTIDSLEPAQENAFLVGAAVAVIGTAVVMAVLAMCRLLVNWFVCRSAKVAAYLEDQQDFLKSAIDAEEKLGNEDPKVIQKQKKALGIMSSLSAFIETKILKTNDEANDTMKKDAKKFYSPNTIGTPNSSATGTSNNADFLIM